MANVIERIKLIGKEILNFITNILIPIWNIVILVAETFGAPANVLDALKKIEYLLFNISGTKETIEQQKREKEKEKEKEKEQK